MQRMAVTQAEAEPGAHLRIAAPRPRERVIVATTSSLFTCYTMPYTAPGSCVSAG